MFKNYTMKGNRRLAIIVLLRALFSPRHALPPRPGRPHARQLIAANTVPHLCRGEDDGPAQQKPAPFAGMKRERRPLWGLR